MSKDALARSNSARDTNDLEMTEEEGKEGKEAKAQWSQQAYLMEELVEQFTLPQVARCDARTILTRRDNPLPVNMASPMLLYEQRTIRKLLARNVLSDARTGRYSETDESVVIPADYQGNFLRLASRTAKDSSVHRSIGSLAVSRVPAFVNLTPITGFRIVSTDANQYPPVEFSAGNVFIVDKAIRGSTKVKNSAPKSAHSNSIIRRNSKDSSSVVTRQELHYLQCRDERDVAVLLPMMQPGEFVDVLPNPFGEDGKLSMRVDDIISTQKFPLLVRYVYGGGRPRLTSFSGLLTLLDSFEEASVVGCVLDGSTFTMMEIPMSSPLLFQIALNSSDLFGLPVVKHALKVCESNGSAYLSDMKFKFKFAQKVLHKTNNIIPEENEVPISATNSARMGLTQTYVYL